MVVLKIPQSRQRRLSLSDATPSKVGLPLDSIRAFKAVRKSVPQTESEKRNLTGYW